MEERRGSNPLLSWPAIVLLATMLGGVYYIPKRLKASRPDEKPAGGRAGLGDQQAPARLWQDPFDAVERYEMAIRADSRNATASDGRLPSAGSLSGVAEFAGQTRRYAQGPTAARTGTNTPAEFTASCLAVMVSGEAYTEDAEVRRRSRHAVVSALGRAGYAPMSENRVGYFQVPWPRGSDLAAMPRSAVRLLPSTAGDSILIVPFEWFQENPLRPPERSRGAPPSGPIAVLWLNTAVFSDHPQKRLAQLWETIRRAVPRDSDATIARHNNPKGAGQDGTRSIERAGSSLALRFTVLNPGLNDMLNESFAAQSAHGTIGDFFSLNEALSGTRAISAWSTSADALLFPEDSPVRRQAISNHLAASGLSLINATCTDDQLACELIDELKLRQVDLTGRRDAVAILSDSDTFYGRALPLTFAATIVTQCEQGRRGGPKAAVLESLRRNPNAWPDHVFSYTYLRGLDGKLPAEPKSAAGEVGEKEGGGSARDLDRPEGQSQMDYLPRLAATLKERDLELRRTGQRGLRAIGVLGSDVYDKLLVLQALHELFPDVIFFTTDLDARLLHPRELGWTRNMVVVSSFGLELDRESQGPVPPFRDTYQTALFLATLAAVNDRHVSAESLASLVPRRFEIGRNGACDISVAKSNVSLHPPRANTFPGTTPFDVLTQGLRTPSCSAAWGCSCSPACGSSKTRSRRGNGRFQPVSRRRSRRASNGCSEP
jgi:hypothetical protein